MKFYFKCILFLVLLIFDEQHQPKGASAQHPQLLEIVYRHFLFDFAVSLAHIQHGVEELRLRHRGSRLDVGLSSNLVDGGGLQNFLL